MSRLVSLISATVLSALLISCTPEAENENPVRAEFMASSDGLIEYKSMKPEKRTALCGCVYDKTVNGLTDTEKEFAHVYLLEQVGIDVQSRKMFSETYEPDVMMNAMTKSSKALGNAAKQCG